MDLYEKQYLYQRMVRAKLYIDSHYAEPIDLRLIADHACCSKFHFIRLFKAIYGKTPHHYLSSVRLNHARILLAEGHTVAEACEAVGFESSTSFANLFKRTVSETPTAFQRRMMTRKVAMLKQPLRFVPNCFVEQMGVKKRNFE
ncbi:MAG: AraC family transcriptional regulator [Cyclobacteriaceae bacterium]|nr:AraC family transcriptional regulator [Cyclobacteriaceae bacterium]